MDSLLELMRQSFSSTFTEPDKNDPEHPYEYITRVYGHTANARITGLPGYTPPTPIRVLNASAYYGTILLVLATLGVLLLAVVGAIMYGLSAITNIVFTVSAPFTGSSLYQTELGIIQITPTLLIGGAYAAILFTVMGVRGLSYRLSRPYEELYEDWLQSVKPSNPTQGYPPSYQALFVSFEDPPESVSPRVYRDDRMSERVYLSVIALVSTVFFMTTVMMLQQWQMMGQDSPPIEKQAERMRTVESRKQRFN